MAGGDVPACPSNLKKRGNEMSQSFEEVFKGITEKVEPIEALALVSLLKSHQKIAAENNRFKEAACNMLNEICSLHSDLPPMEHEDLVVEIMSYESGE